MAGKTVLVTGAATGIGFALSQKLLTHGFHVVATMRGLSKREGQFAEWQERYPGRLHLLELDICVPDQIAQVKRYLTKTRPDGSSLGLDGLVNNAGYALFGPGEDLTLAQMRQQLETNFFGTVQLTQALLPLLRVSRGHLITVSSVFGLIGFPMSSAYCASKFALEGYFESLYYELAHQQVAVTIIEPGGHRTKFVDNSARAAAVSSPYAQMMDSFETMQHRMLEKRGVPSENVALAIVRALRVKKPPLRVTVGQDAYINKVLGRLLPGEWRVRMLRHIVLRMMHRQGTQAKERVLA